MTTTTMSWTDPELEARYERNLARLEELRRTRPDLYTEFSLPYKALTEDDVHGIQRMRLIWLRDNHPQEFTEMRMADVLEEHLRQTERRTRERYARNLDMLMEQRHLLRRTDVVQAHPEITEDDRLHGTMQAQRDAMDMAIHEIVESF